MFALLVICGIALSIIKGMLAKDLTAFVFWVVLAIACAVTLGQMYMGNIHV